MCSALKVCRAPQLGSHPTEQYTLSTVHSLLEPRSIQRDFCCIRLVMLWKINGICTGLLVGSMKGIVKSRRCFLATHDTLRDDEGSFFFTISSVRHGCRPHTNADAHAHTLAHMLAETLLWYHQQTTVDSKLGKYAWSLQWRSLLATINRQRQLNNYLIKEIHSKRNLTINKYII